MNTNINLNPIIQRNQGDLAVKNCSSSEKAICFAGKAVYFLLSNPVTNFARAISQTASGTFVTLGTTMLIPGGAALIGAAIGSVFPGLGTVIGGIGGQIIGISIGVSLISAGVGLWILSTGAAVARDLIRSIQTTKEPIEFISKFCIQSLKSIAIGTLYATIGSVVSSIVILPVEIVAILSVCSTIASNAIFAKKVVLNTKYFFDKIEGLAKTSHSKNDLKLEDNKTKIKEYNIKIDNRKSQKMPETDSKKISRDSLKKMPKIDLKNLSLIDLKNLSKTDFKKK